MRYGFASLALALTVALAGGAVAADKVQVGEGKVFPESFGAGPDGTLYVGSITMGEVYKAAPGATKTEPFIAKAADGPSAVLGVYADGKAGLLWVCYADLALFAGQPGKASIARSYDLASGALKASYNFPENSFCNDIASTADGTVYLADTFGARVMRLKPGATDLEAWITDKALGGVDGISVGPDGNVYVNNVMTNKLYRIPVGSDGVAGVLAELTPSTPLKGTDGMRFGPNGKLYVAENGAGQADVLTIDGDNVTVKPLITGLDAPTAVDFAGGSLWVLEAKIDKMQDANENGPFYVVPAPME